MNKTLEKLKKAWLKIKNEEISLEDAFEKFKITDGESVLLQTAVFEWRLVKIVTLLEVEKRAGKDLRDKEDVEDGLIIEFKHHYESFDEDEKWGLMPLFFDLVMKTHKSLYMSEELLKTYYILFRNYLLDDGLSEADLKKQFLLSGYNQLMPFIYQLEPELFGKQN